MPPLHPHKQIWKALSEFYLDTELSDSDYLRIANTLKQFNLSIAELKEIDLYEVFPSLQRNLNSPAGVWAGFEESWLVEICTKNFQRKGNVLFRLLTRWRNKGAYWMRKEQWDNVEALMQRSA